MQGPRHLDGPIEGGGKGGRPCRGAQLAGAEDDLHPLGTTSTSIATNCDTTGGLDPQHRHVLPACTTTGNGQRSAAIAQGVPRIPHRPASQPLQFLGRVGGKPGRMGEQAGREEEGGLQLGVGYAGRFEVGGGAGQEVGYAGRQLRVL